MPRFMMDAHTHSQRFTPGLLRRGEAFTYRALEHAIMTRPPYDNSRALLLDMDRLLIDMAVLNTAFGMRNELIAAQVRRYPDRFVGFCGPVETQTRAFAGAEPFSAEKAAIEIDYWLSQPGFVGVGELVSVLPDPDISIPVDQNLAKMYPMMEVVRHHRVPILIHTGCISYPSMCRLRAVDPALIDDLAVRYPDVPIIIGHMGTCTSWWDAMPETARMVAARHANVYLETCQATAAQIERAYLDPQIGADRLIFGSDFGASIAYRRIEGRTYAVTPPEQPPQTLALHQDWCLRQIMQIEMPEDDRAKILGLNMARLCRIDVEARLRRQMDERYGPPIRPEDAPVDLGWETVTKT
jgi:predicted TIM-barrel fold metal-dependent hydrolase